MRGLLVPTLVSSLVLTNSFAFFGLWDDSDKESRNKVNIVSNTGAVHTNKTIVINEPQPVQNLPRYTTRTKIKDLGCDGCESLYDVTLDACEDFPVTYRSKSKTTVKEILTIKTAPDPVVAPVAMGAPIIPSGININQANNNKQN